MAMQTVENPTIPFVYPIGNGLQTGSEIILSGATYNGRQKQFAVNLNGEGDNVVLHVNPRFKFLEDTVVLNNRTYSGWQKEERHRNRFSVGDTFRLRIVCHHSHFVIFVNDKELANFEHRLAPQMVRSIEVTGDVVLHRINLINMVPQQPQPYQPQFAPPQPYPNPSEPHFGFVPSPPPLGFPDMPTPSYPPNEQPQPNFPQPNFPQPNFPRPNFPQPNYPSAHNLIFQRWVTPNHMSLIHVIEHL